MWTLFVFISKISHIISKQIQAEWHETVETVPARPMRDQLLCRTAALWGRKRKSCSPGPDWEEVSLHQWPGATLFGSGVQSGPTCGSSQVFTSKVTAQTTSGEGKDADGWICRCAGAWENTVTDFMLMSVPSSIPMEPRRPGRWFWSELSHQKAHFFFLFFME